MSGSRPDAYRRDAGCPFDSLEREQYAKERAKGASIKGASSGAGISVATGTTYERHPEIKARIRELRQGTETYVGVSKAWIIRELMVNVTSAREADAYKASTEALALLYKIISDDKSIASDMGRALDHNVTPKQLQKRLADAFKAPTLTAGKERIQQPAFDSEPIEAEGEAP